MNTTPNINLSTYTSDPNDKFNLLVTFNNNMTKIDTAVGSQNDQIELIETTASTAVSTANTASATATEALTTAEGKTSVNDNVASATTTYSSNKINELLDDKASINDTTASASTTYSSNKIENLVNSAVKIPTYNNITTYSTTEIRDGSTYLTYTATADCLIIGWVSEYNPSDNSLSIDISPTGENFREMYIDTVNGLFTGIPPIFVKANTVIKVRVYQNITAEITLKICPL